MTERLTLDDLWRLAYFTGKPVVLTMAGGHDTWHIVVWNGMSFNADDETDIKDLRQIVEDARRPHG